MKYAYEDLSDEQFENLIVFLCQKLLGISVKGFSTGPDGGRDAKFQGTAELHPSTVAPWVGITVVQAKHTNGYNKRFSEPDFFSTDPSAHCILNDELPRIKKLRVQKQVDHYMLFANRRLGGNADSDIAFVISNYCGIPTSSIYLCGVEQLERLLKRFPEVADLANLDPVDSPLIIGPDELAEVIQAFAQQKDAFKNVIDQPPTPRVPYETKNALNNMTPEYARAQRRKYLKETSQIRTFLAAPENAELQRLYESIVDEFQMKIIAHRRDYQTFDKLMEYLLNLLFNRDAVLRQHAHKRLTRAVLFYMYWNCDIGEDGDAQADQTLAS